MRVRPKWRRSGQHEDQGEDERIERGRATLADPAGGAAEGREHYRHGWRRLGAAGKVQCGIRVLASAESPHPLPPLPLRWARGESPSLAAMADNERHPGVRTRDVTVPPLPAHRAGYPLGGGLGGEGSAQPETG